MPGKSTAVVAVTGFGAGIASTIAAYDIPSGGVSRVLCLTAVRLLPLMCVTTVTLVALRRWITVHDERTRRDVTTLNEDRRRFQTERQHFEEECRRRTAALAAREKRVQEAAEANVSQLGALATQLDRTHRELVAVQEQYDALQRDYDEMAADHTLLVRETLQERAVRFSRRPSVAGIRPTGGRSAAGPLPHPADRTSSPATRLPWVGGVLVAQPQHDRAAEGVGDPA